MEGRKISFVVLAMAGLLTACGSRVWGDDSEISTALASEKQRSVRRMPKHGKIRLLKYQTAFRNRCRRLMTGLLM